MRENQRLEFAYDMTVKSRSERKSGETLQIPFLRTSCRNSHGPPRPRHQGSKDGHAERAMERPPVNHSFEQLAPEALGWYARRNKIIFCQEDKFYSRQDSLPEQPCSLARTTSLVQNKLRGDIAFVAMSQCELVSQLRARIAS